MRAQTIRGARNASTFPHRVDEGIFVRDLAEFARSTGTTAYNQFLTTQASSILANDTDGDGQSGLQWAGPLNNLVYPNQQSASDAFNAALDLQTGAITGYGSLCVDVADSDTANGTKVDIYTCNGTGAQTWLPQANGSLLNPQSGKCLDDPGFNTAPGTQLEIWDCNGGANQHWSVP